MVVGVLLLRQMKLKQLESELCQIGNFAFSEPKIVYEQYPTSPHIAAQMLYLAENTFEDIEGRNVLDLGCGTGILSLGASFLGAAAVLGVDIDEDALEIARVNAEENADIDFLLSNATNLTALKKHSFDVVLMNPPFVRLMVLLFIE